MSLGRGLVLVLLLATAGADMFPLTVPLTETLQIHNDHLVSAYVGNPGKWLRLRVRADTSKIYLFQHPEPFSRSWIQLPEPDDPTGQPRVRDTLILGTTQMRAEMVIGAFPDETKATTEGTQAEGVLGIGAQSPLWVLWRNFTKQRDALMLGTLLSTDNGVSADLAPPWAYGLGLVSTYVVELRATLSESSRRALERACIDALGSVIDDSADFAGADASLMRVLGVEPGEHLCSVQAEYRLLLVPESDYNVIPRALLMHPPKHPPTFHVQGVGDGGFSAVLFNRHEDYYVDVDVTSGVGAGIPHMANRARPGKNNTIVLGEYGLRRFEIAYDLDEAVAYVALRRAGISHTSKSRAADQSIEVRRIQDIYVLVPGFLLFALLATEPDPVFAPHLDADETAAEKDDDSQFAHATNGPRLDVTSGTTPIVPPAEMRSNGTFVVQVDPPDEETPVADAVDEPPKAAVAAAPGQTELLARDTCLRIGAIISASFRMRSEWPVSASTLLYVQALAEGVIMVYFLLGLAFYDTAWALTFVINTGLTSPALGWITVGVLVAVIGVLSVAGVLVAGIDARLGSLALQTEVLLGIYVLLISLFEWDLALALLFVVIAITVVVCIVAALTTCGLVPQYEQNSHRERRALRTAVLAVSAVWVVYALVAVIPFVVNRLWDSNDYAIWISMFLVCGVATPFGVFMSFAPFIYPLLTANAACQRVFAGTRARYSIITGNA